MTWSRNNIVAYVLSHL